MRPRLPISLRRSISVLAPAPTPMMQIRPPVASASRFSARFGAPTSSRIDVELALLGEALGRDRVDAERGDLLAGVLVADRRGHARARHHAELDGGHADAARRAVDEQPLADGQAAWVKSASWAVVKTSGTPPAAVQSSSSGTGIAVRSCTTANSAWPPPATIAITRSPGSKRPTRRPQATTSPASSRPGMSGGRARRRGVVPGELHHVGAVEAGGVDADQQLAVLGLGIGVLGDLDPAVANRGGTHAPESTLGSHAQARASSPSDRRGTPEGRGEDAPGRQGPLGLRGAQAGDGGDDRGRRAPAHAGRPARAAFRQIPPFGGVV